MLQPVLQNPWVRAVGVLLSVFLIAALAYILRPVLVPLFLALTVAYVLDPVVDFFEARRIPRMLTIIGLAVVAVILALSVPLVVVPSVYKQATSLIASGKGIPQFSVIDADGDGALSRAELRARQISFDENRFKSSDLDKNNVLSAEEAAQVLELQESSGVRGGALLDWALDRLPVNALVRMLNLDDSVVEGTEDAGTSEVTGAEQAQTEVPLTPAEPAAEPGGAVESKPSEEAAESDASDSQATEAFVEAEREPEARALLAEFIGTTVRDFALQFAKTHAGSIASFGQQAGMNVFGFLASMGQGALNFVLFMANFALFAIVAGYLLKDFDPLKASARTLIPPRYAPKALQVLGDIDEQLRSFLRGQMTVCVCLGAMYTIGFLIGGVPFALVIGIFAIAASFIPFVGVAATALIAILLTLLQYGIDWHIVWVLIVVGVAQFLEGNVLTPKIVGDKVGLNPVWVILAIMVFGNFLGFLGLLLAVPIAAALKVLVVEGVAYYKASPLFEGVDATVESPPPGEETSRRKKRR